MTCTDDDRSTMHIGGMNPNLGDPVSEASIWAHGHGTALLVEPSEMEEIQTYTWAELTMPWGLCLHFVWTYIPCKRFVNRTGGKG